MGSTRQAVVGHVDWLLEGEEMHSLVNLTLSLAANQLSEHGHLLLFVSQICELGQLSAYTGVAKMVSKNLLSHTLATGAHRPGIRCQGVPWESTEHVEKKLFCTNTPQNTPFFH